MNDSTLSKIWTLVCLFAIYSGVNGVADVQGSAFLLPFALEVHDERGKAAKAIFWFIFTALPYLLALNLAHAYAKRKAHKPAFESWPVMFNLPLLMADPLARRYQKVWLVICLSLPMYSCVFLLNEVLELEVVRRRDVEVTASGWVGQLTSFRWGRDYLAMSGEDRRLLADTLNRKEQRAPTIKERNKLSVSYYPGFQPWLFTAVTLLVMIQWLGVVRELWRRSRARQPAKRGEPLPAPTAATAG
jgi:hypothetical protein